MIAFEEARKHPVYQHIPVQTLDALYDYVDNHSDLNRFLLSVLSNDLSETVSSGSLEDLHSLKQLMAFVARELPTECHGSRYRIGTWLMYKSNID